MCTLPYKLKIDQSYVQEKTVTKDKVEVATRVIHLSFHKAPSCMSTFVYVLFCIFASMIDINLSVALIWECFLPLAGYFWA